MEAIMRVPAVPVAGIYAQGRGETVTYYARREMDEYGQALCKELHGVGNNGSCVLCRGLLEQALKADTPWWKP